MDKTVPSKFDVFLFSPFFYPEQISTGKYNTFLAKGLVEAGQRVGVCSSYPLYPEWLPKVTNSSLPGMQIIRGGAWLRFPKSIILRRMLLECWYAVFAFCIAVRYRKQMARALVVFPPNLFQLLVHQILPGKTRKIGIVHDLQAGLGRQQAGFLGKVIEWVEGRALRSCDTLIFLSSRMKERAVSLYGLPSEHCHVHYPFVTISVPLGETGCQLTDIFNPDFVHAVYSGALGEKQAPGELLELFQAVVSSNQHVCCHVFSRGQQFEWMRQQSALAGNDRIEFHDLVNEADLPELYARSSVQVLPQRKGTSDFAFPSKLPNLVASGVPVFAITDKNSEVYDIIKAYERGQVVTTWDIETILPVFDAFLKRVGSDQSQEGSQDLLARFDLDRLVAVLLEGKSS